MNRTQFAFMMAAIAAVILLGMWLAWRGRAKRDAGMRVETPALSGAVVAEFVHASYVSTTPTGAPLERIAIPGLRYKGFADVSVRTDGVSITVTGEDPVNLKAAQLRGTSTASGRVGKFVEQNGLSLLQWQPAPTGDARTDRELESSFRFADVAEQQQFSDAIDQITSSQTPKNSKTQEEA